MSNRLYLGINCGSREIFSSKTIPTKELTPEYLYVIGPFRTRRGAEFMRDYGVGNPHCRTVNEAERLGLHFAANQVVEEIMG